jgi:hypothetical protein
MRLLFTVFQHINRLKHVYIISSTYSSSTFITQCVNKVLTQILTPKTLNEHIIKPHYKQHIKA